MRAGGSYHRVNFYAKVITRNDYGASVDSWPVITISTRGEVRWTGGNFTMANEEKTYNRNMELIVRYRPNISETMRVQIDNTTDSYIINYMEILGRNEGLRLTLEKINEKMPVSSLESVYLFNSTMMEDSLSLR